MSLFPSLRTRPPSGAADRGPRPPDDLTGIMPRGGLVVALPMAILKRGYKWHVTLVAAQLIQSSRTQAYVLDSPGSIAADLGIPVHKVRDALARLSEDGWIYVDLHYDECRDRVRSVYWLRWLLPRPGQGGDS